MHAAANTTRDIAGLGLHAPVTIARDARGIPHIRAHDEHDLFFADGYVEGADRLFQMDLLRRFVEGRLAEVMGPTALESDEYERNVPVEQIAQREWEHLDAAQRAALQAYSEGVNAAMQREPTPVEFRILLYKPEPWKPQDSLAVAMATVLDLTDTWNDIAPRDAAYRRSPVSYDRDYPLTDPCYDAPLTAGLASIVASPHCSASTATIADPRPPVGSNEFAAGGDHTTTGRALIANDPHLSLRIPGVWYMIDLQAPGYHVAGTSFPGTPGVILGHNDHVAWAATNGTVSSLSAFIAPANLDPRYWQEETFKARFGATVHRSYYRGPREFGVTLHDGRLVLVRWNVYTVPSSPVETFDLLDRAPNIEAALVALEKYPNPTQNFAIADTSGRVAYHLAGSIPDDPAWSRYIHNSADLSRDYPPVPFEALPSIAPSRAGIIWTANNKMYGAGYPLRLSPTFAPPYRAYRIAQMLHARAKYDVDYFREMEMDTLSLPERELSRAVPAFSRWDGYMRPDSTIATSVAALRRALTGNANARMAPTLMAMRSGTHPILAA